MVTTAVYGNPDRGTNMLDDGKMEGITFLDAAGEQVGSTMSANDAAWNALGDGLGDLIFSSDKPSNWDKMMPAGVAKKYYWRGVVATGTANATRTYSLGTVMGTYLNDSVEDIEVNWNWANTEASRLVINDTVGIVLQVPDVWLAPSDAAAWGDFALGWLPWKFDYSGTNTGLDGIANTLEQYSAEAKRAVFTHFANRTLPAALALAGTKTDGELEGLLPDIDGYGRVSFFLVDTAAGTGNPCHIDPSTPEGFGAMSGIAAYAGLYQSMYAYTQERDARIQGIQLAVQVVQIVATIIAAQGIAQVSGLSAWMNQVSTGLPWAARQSLGEALIEGIFDELIKENVISYVAEAAIEATGFEGLHNEFLNIDLSAQSIAEQIGETGSDVAQIAFNLKQSVSDHGVEMTADEQFTQRIFNEEVAQQFEEGGGQISEELGAFLDAAGFETVARLAAMAAQCRGQGPVLANMLEARMQQSQRSMSEQVMDLVGGPRDRFSQPTFPADVWETIDANPNAVVDAIAADIILAEDSANIGEAINAPGSNTRFSSGMDQHMDKQVDLHVRMRDGSLRVVNEQNTMTKAEFLAGAVKVEKITDTSSNVPQHTTKETVIERITNADVQRLIPPEAHIALESQSREIVENVGLNPGAQSDACTSTTLGEVMQEGVVQKINEMRLARERFGVSEYLDTARDPAYYSGAELRAIAKGAAHGGELSTGQWVRNMLRKGDVLESLEAAIESDNSFLDSFRKAAYQDYSLAPDFVLKVIQASNLGQHPDLSSRQISAKILGGLQEVLTQQYLTNVKGMLDMLKAKNSPVYKTLLESIFIGQDIDILDIFNYRWEIKTTGTQFKTDVRLAAVQLDALGNTIISGENPVSLLSKVYECKSYGPDAQSPNNQPTRDMARQIIEHAIQEREDFNLLLNPVEITLSIMDIGDIDLTNPDIINVIRRQGLNGLLALLGSIESIPANLHYTFNNLIEQLFFRDASEIIFQRAHSGKEYARIRNSDFTVRWDEDINAFEIEVKYDVMDTHTGQWQNSWSNELEINLNWESSSLQRDVYDSNFLAPLLGILATNPGYFQNLVRRPTV